MKCGRFFLLLLLLSLPACFVPVDLWAASPVPLRIALIPLRPPARMYRDFLPLKQYLEKTLHRRVSLEVVRKNSKIASLFRSGASDIAFVCPTLYCELSRRVRISPLVKLKIHGRDHYRSVLVVRSDSEITRTADLAGRTLVYGRHSCPGSGLLPQIMFRRLGMTDDDFFEVVKLGNDESALLTVMGRMFDVTGVPEMAVRSLGGKGVRVIRYSRPIPQYLFAARAGLGRKTISAVREALLALDDETVLAPLEEGADGFSPARDSEYDIVRILQAIAAPGKEADLPQGGRTLVVEPLYFGADLFWRLQPLLDLLRRGTGLDVRLRIPRDMAAFTRLFREGRDDLYLLEREVAARLDSGVTRPLAGLELLPAADNAALVITARSSGVRRLEDLRGQKIALPFALSEGGYGAQARLLEKAGVHLDAADMIPVGTCEAVAMAVYHGRAGAGFLTAAALRDLEPDLQPGRLRVVARAPLSPWDLIAGGGLTPAVRRRIAEALRRTPFHPVKDSP